MSGGDRGSGRGARAVAFAAVACLGLGVFADLAPGQTGPEPGWSLTRLDPATSASGARIASQALGTSVLIRSGTDDDGPALFSSLAADWGDFGPAQSLGGSGAQPSVDGSWAGGTVAAWDSTSSATIDVATLAPGASRFQLASLPGLDAIGSIWNESPIVSVGEGGAAAVAFAAISWDEVADRSVSRIFVSFRPPGGAFGEPEPVSARSTGWLQRTDLDVGPDGTVAIGLNDSGEAELAVRSPTGTWSGPGSLGTTSPRARPKVAVDGSGGVVAAVADLPDEDNAAGVTPLRVTFRPAGGPDSQQLETGITITDWDHFDLAVSALGEVVLVSDSTIPVEDFGRLDGIKVLLGNSVREQLGPPAKISVPFGGSSPLLAMNSRGDAVILASGSDPRGATLQAYRRAPGGSFGRAIDVHEPTSRSDGISWTPPTSATIDPYGNAFVIWDDTNFDPTRSYLAASSPRVTVRPPTPALGADLPPASAFPIEDWGPIFPSYPSHQPRFGDDGKPPQFDFWQIPVATRHELRFKAMCDEDCWTDLRITVAGPVKFRPLRIHIQPGKKARAYFRARNPGVKLMDAARRGARFTVRGTVRDHAGNARRFHTKAYLVAPRDIIEGPRTGG